MRRTLATCALAGVLGLTGAAVALPAVSYAATGDSTALDSRVSSIADALKGLVTDGTITQAQADEVASTLAEARPERGLGGRGVHGVHGGRVDLAAAAEALGMTEAELRTAAESGSTLADLAEAEGVSQAELVRALVAAEEERLADAVAAGRLTQAEADERAAGAQARITASLDDPIDCGGRGGRGGFHHRGGPEGSTPDDEAPAESPSAAPSATTSSAA